MHGQPKNKPRLNQKQDRWHKKKQHNPRNKKMQSPVTDIIIIIISPVFQCNFLHCTAAILLYHLWQNTTLSTLSSLSKNYRRVLSLTNMHGPQQTKRALSLLPPDQASIVLVGTIPSSQSVQMGKHHVASQRWSGCWTEVRPQWLS